MLDSRRNDRLAVPRADRVRQYTIRHLGSGRGALDRHDARRLGYHHRLVLHRARDDGAGNGGCLGDRAHRGRQVDGLGDGLGAGGCGRAAGCDVLGTAEDGVRGGDLHGQGGEIEGRGGGGGGGLVQAAAVVEALGVAVAMCRGQSGEEDGCEG